MDAFLFPLISAEKSVSYPIIMNEAYYYYDVNGYFLRLFFFHIQNRNKANHGQFPFFVRKDLILNAG